jgi:hypothetical protein
MDRFNTPWRVTAAAIYTTPTDSRVYGTLDIDVTEAKKYLVRKREEGIKITMVHLATAVLARAIAFDVPEMNCFIRRGAVVGVNIWTSWCRSRLVATPALPRQ